MYTFETSKWDRFDKYKNNTETSSIFQATDRYRRQALQNQLAQYFSNFELLKS